MIFVVTVYSRERKLVEKVMDTKTLLCVVTVKFLNQCY